MKRAILAVLVGGAIFGTVWGLAASLSVPWSTAASGSNTVGSCGDVTGSTFILEGLTGNNLDSGYAYLSESPSDISQFDRVNIEVDDGCENIDAWVEVRDGSGTPIFSGKCTVHDTGGLGWDETETGPGDNTDGCTVSEDPADVEDAETIVVTMT